MLVNEERAFRSDEDGGGRGVKGEAEGGNQCSVHVEADVSSLPALNGMLGPNFMDGQRG